MSEEATYFKNRKLIPNSKLKELAKGEEQRLIALLLKDKEVLRDVATKPGLSYRSFFWVDSASAFSVIIKYFDKHESMLTRDSFKALVVAQYPPEVAGRMINALNIYSASRVNPEDYSQIRDGILARAAQQEFYARCGGGDAFADILNKTDDQRESIQKFIMKMEDLSSFLSDQDDEFSKTVDLTDSVMTVADIMKARRDSPAAERGIMCGFNTIDQEFNGFRFGKYGVFLGLPNGGKTTMMLNFASNMAMAGRKVCYVTIESNAEEITERLLARVTRIPSKVMKKGGVGDDGLTDARMDTILTTADEIVFGKKNKAGEIIKKSWGDNLTFISVIQKTPITEILAKIERKRKFCDFDVVFFDYLDVIGHMVKRTDRADLELADTSQRIQGWGKERGIQVWSAQSIKNEKIKELHKKEFVDNAEKSYVTVGVEDVGGTQAISRDADYILSVVPHPSGGKLIIYVTKARYDAPAGLKFVLDWEPDICNVSDVNNGFLASGEDMQKIAEAGGEAYLDKLPGGGVTTLWSGHQSVNKAPDDDTKEHVEEQAVAAPATGGALV